jgi:hypothetical protein
MRRHTCRNRTTRRQHRARFVGLVVTDLITINPRQTNRGQPVGLCHTRAGVDAMPTSSNAYFINRDVATSNAARLAANGHQCRIDVLNFDLGPILGAAVVYRLTVDCWPYPTDNQPSQRATLADARKQPDANPNPNP